MSGKLGEYHWIVMIWDTICSLLASFMEMLEKLSRKLTGSGFIDGVVESQDPELLIYVIR